MFAGSLYVADLMLLVYGAGVTYSTHSNLNMMYNWGALVGIMVLVQLVSGVLLACSYVANYELSFEVLDYMMRDGSLLWAKRAWHSNGAAMVFGYMYIHLFRAIVYGVASRVHLGVWVSGVLILLAMMGIAFMGYVLPWGLMSYWALTVITNLVSVIPVFGMDVLLYIWGGFYITTVTVQRFFALHFVLPLLIVVVLMIHIGLLHSYGSGSIGGVLGCDADSDHFGMFYYKDVFVVVIGCGVLAILMFVFSDSLHHADNFQAVDRFMTPAHIVPEWYFLPYYSILRSCSSKLLGVLMLLFGVIVFGFLVGVHMGSVGSYSAYNMCESAMILVLLSVLGLLGGCFPVFPYVELSGSLSAAYFWLHLR